MRNKSLATLATIAFALEATGVAATSGTLLPQPPR